MREGIEQSTSSRAGSAGPDDSDFHSVAWLFTATLEQGLDKDHGESRRWRRRVTRVEADAE